MIVCITGAGSGCGKTHIAKKLINHRTDYTPWLMYTSRPPRANEKNGIDYHFISDAELEQMRKDGMILEERQYTRTDGTFSFCTKLLEIERAKSGVWIFMEQTLESAFQVLDYYEKKNDILVLIFLLLAEDTIRLERIRKRGGLGEDEISRRMTADAEDFSRKMKCVDLEDITRIYSNNTPEDGEHIVNSIIDVIEFFSH